MRAATVRLPFARKTVTVRAVPRQKITAKLLATLTPGAIVRDATTPGFFAVGLRADPTVVALKVQADFRPGPRGTEARRRSTVRLTLGRWPELALDVARAEAMRVLAEVKAGRDPRPGAPDRSAWTVERLVSEYATDLRTRGKSERTVDDHRSRFDRYLGAWAAAPLASVTRTMAREAHARITREHGPVVANDTLRNFRAAFNWARKATDQGLGENPADAVSFNPQRARTEVLTFPDLPTWIARVRALSNPLRAAMHELGLFSGLRPGVLVALERAWVRLDASAIVVPAGRMKARVEFALPLSAHMADLVRRALLAGDVMFPRAPFVFPTRAQRSGEVVATQVWREAALPSETGHILRHMFSNACNQAGVSSVDRMLLMAQRVPGVEGMYLNDRALFRHLLGDQERVTAWLQAQL
jgi:integrase